MGAGRSGGDAVSCRTVPAPLAYRGLPAPLSAIAALFFTSGATALLYQVAFGKKLGTIFGATAYAVSAVLAAFMGGLALGSYLGGRYGRRFPRPLVVYGVAEIAVGAVCAITPWLFVLLEQAYVSAAQAMPSSLATVSALRTVLTGAVVLVPTVAMGVTLPMLSRVVAGAEGERSRRDLAILYAVNTAGGATGALASAYFVLPALGVAATMRSAAVINVLIGVIGIWLGRASTIEKTASTGRALSRGPRDGLYGALAAASGLLVFASEVVDTHLLTLLIGNSAYAFGLMLAAFLTCLSLGAGMAGAIERRFGDRALGYALLVAAFCLLLTVPVWGQLPRVFLATGHRVSSWLGREIVRAVVAFAALLVPTTAMGLTFPMLLRQVAGRPDVERQVGRLTAINTIGSIVGAVLSGYVILPALGSEGMLRAVALCFALCAAFAAPRQRAVQIAGFVACAVAVMLPSWDMKLMTNGANVYFDSQPSPDALVFVREDVHGGLTSVARRGDVLTLYTNGKFQGDDGAEITAQRSFAHFPAMFVKQHRRALVIGLGTGTTLGTINAYPFERIDVAEISPAIVTAARTYFSGPNRNSLDDPRVVLEMNDGRNVLLLAREPYDLITIELTSVWFAGAANLYSAEFYALCRDRLAPSGVLQQWVQLHHIRRTEVAVVLRTLRSAFEHVALFVSGGQGILVASAEPLVVSPAWLDELESRPDVRATLGEGESLRTLLDRLMLSTEQIDRFVSETPGPPLISTDDNLYLEHATPKGNVMGYHKSLEGMLDTLKRYRADDPAAAHLR